jgi:molybdopterin-containing oxidoreductase family iron-sulfur binding subunit
MKHHDHEHDHSPAQVPAGDNRYWQSLEQWSNDPEFRKLVETEFQSSPLREGNEQEEGWARREFLKLMGASLAMASAGCIRRPVQKIVPYNKQPEEVTFGVQNLYTSTWTDGSEILGLLIRTREGRPLKVEGNPQHPFNKGGLSARANAHILSLYDPERLQAPKKNLQNKERTNRETVSVTWEDADDAIVKSLKKGGVALLTGPLTGPATRAVVSDFAQAFKATHVTWSPLNEEDLRQGAKASYGEEAVPFYRFDKAKVIVSIDADFLGTWLAPTTFNRQFADGRRNPKEMSKLVVFDSNYSLTGANADVRIRIKPSQQLDAVMGLAHAIVVKKGQTRFAGNAAVKAALDPFAGAAAKLGVEEALFDRLADDLIKNKGQSLIVAGGPVAQTAHAKQLQIAVNFLNSALENDGSTVDARAGFSYLKGSHLELMSLIEDMKKGQIKTLIIHGVNPMYSFAGAKDFAEALKKVETVVYTGDRNDETGKLANYVLPDHHPMEGWGDAEMAGVYAIQQPTIRPMYDTRSFQLSLMSWAYTAGVGSKRLLASETFYDFLRAYWKEEIHPKFGKGKSFEAFWDEALQTGVVGADSMAKGGARSFKAEALSSVKPVSGGGDFELVLYPTVMFMDGSLSNVSWLHEMPDPVTKICWDNYASVSIATAEKMHLHEGDMIELTVGDQKAKLPIHIQPGLHDQVVAVALGYGRTAAGKVGNNVGWNAYQFVQSAKDGFRFAGMPTSIKKTGQKYQLASVQSHHSMEGRQIVVEATLKQYLKDPSANIHRHAVFSIWSGHQYNGHKWGMYIDQNVCTGCSACMIACQSENNIPVVGKKYVLQGREMHWLRIDRYYVGDPKEAETVFQPMLCQHCNTAPCETVCPVLATVHSSEGLSEMVYNRCVGTRYCSNNCPYKVRRFNWFNYTKNIQKPLHLALNPDVNVRSRGVMEKCTFCVHRIKNGKIKAKLEKRELKDGEIKTACQETCPTGAIVFGDLNDENSQVAKVFKNEKRGYAVLEEFNTQPSVRYLSKIRNNDKETRFEGAHKEGGHA